MYFLGYLREWCSGLTAGQTLFQLIVAPRPHVLVSTPHMLQRGMSGPGAEFEVWWVNFINRSRHGPLQHTTTSLRWARREETPFPTQPSTSLDILDP
jgi:hypothetical protein